MVVTEEGTLFSCTRNCNREQKKEHCFLVHEIVIENTGKLTSYAANVSFSQTFFPRVKKY